MPSQEQCIAEESGSTPDPILLSTCFIVTVTWEIESLVKQARSQQPDQVTLPQTACLYLTLQLSLQLVSPAILVSTGPFPSSINGSCGLPCMPTLVFHLCLFSVPKTSHQSSPALSLLSASPQRSVVPCCLGFHHRYPSVRR